ncbi:MAG: hypothetical protein AAF614_40465 [Chloroflexota bacterium]
MKDRNNIPRLIFIYAILLTLFTALMVGLSLFTPDAFFAAYDVVGDRAFQYSWSFRYVVILAIMVLGLVRRTRESIFLVIFSRFLVDLFDAIGILLYNTPPFSMGSFAFQLIALLGLQLYCLYRLSPLRIAHLP